MRSPAPEPSDTLPNYDPKPTLTCHGRAGRRLGHKRLLCVLTCFCTITLPYHIADQTPASALSKFSGCSCKGQVSLGADQYSVPDARSLNSALVGSVFGAP